MSLLALFRRTEPPDGAAPALEQAVTGFSPAMLDTMAEGDTTPAGRRGREADAGAEMVDDALGAKVLHAWLQNRHQTLMPLSLNLAVMAPEAQRALAAILASLLLAGRPDADARALAPAMRNWLAGVGAKDDVLASFDDAMAAPLPLNTMLELAQTHDLVVYTYVAALMASDPRFPVSTMLCDMVQARFDIPSATVRSAVRRYRR